MTERRALGDFGERVAKAHLCQRSNDHGDPRPEHDTGGTLPQEIAADDGRLREAP